MGLFLKDFYMTINSQKDRSVIQKTIDSNLEAYYSALLKMTCNFESSVGKQTRNQTITSLKTFIDTMASEDYLNSQSLIFRVWF